MRSILLEKNDDLAALLPDLFNRAGVTLLRVRTEQMLLQEANLLHPTDFLLLDCSLGESKDWDQCARILRSTSTSVSVIHHPTKRPAALIKTYNDVEWISSDFGLLPFLERLRARQLACTTPHALSQSHLPAGGYLNGDHSKLPKLSCQEQHVLELLVKGKTNAQIAEALGIREGTVKTYVSRVCIKWNLSTRTELAQSYAWIARANSTSKVLPSPIRSIASLVHHDHDTAFPSGELDELGTSPPLALPLTRVH